MGKKTKGTKASPEPDGDLGLGSFLDGVGVWEHGGPDTIYEEDEEDEEDYEEDAPPAKTGKGGGNKGGQQHQRGEYQNQRGDPRQQQKGGGQQRGNKGDQNQRGAQQQQQKGGGHQQQKGGGQQKGNKGDQNQRGAHQQQQKGGGHQKENRGDQNQRGDHQQQQRGVGQQKGNTGIQNQMGCLKSLKWQKGQKHTEEQPQETWDSTAGNWAGNEQTEWGGEATTAGNWAENGQTGWGGATTTTLEGEGATWGTAASNRAGEAPGWGSTGVNDLGGPATNNDWGASTSKNRAADRGGNDAGATGNLNNWGADAATGWGERGNGEYESRQNMQTPPGSSTHLHQQHRLASLLNQTWTPDTERGRGTNYRQGRAPTPAETIKAAANGRGPSRTLMYAVTGSTSSILDGGVRGGQYATIQIHETGHVALHQANRALYGRQRPVSQRIHWMFSPTKDERVARLLDWIQAMSHELAALGVHKFLRTEQRGALIANADFRPWKAPSEPAFDWVTFDDVIDTHDRTLQESMAFYEPENQVLVFVFLLSHSGNSIAMWRRKLAIPNALYNQNRAELARITKNLAKRRYAITVDELPPPTPNDKQKKKWFNIRW